MRILAFSDLHNKIDAAEKIAEIAVDVQADVVLFAGDFTQFGPIENIKKVISIFKEKKVKLFVTAGNCDPPESEDIFEAEQVNLMNKAESVDNYLFIGISRSISDPFGDFKNKSQIDLLMPDTDYSQVIILTHNPPAGTSVACIYSGRDVGSHSLRKIIEYYNPLLVVCGHIHESPGIDKIGPTTVINPGPASSGKYAIIDIDSRDVSVQLRNIERS